MWADIQRCGAELWGLARMFFDVNFVRWHNGKSWAKLSRLWNCVSAVALLKKEKAHYVFDTLLLPELWAACASGWTGQTEIGSQTALLSKGNAVLKKSTRENHTCVRLLSDVFVTAKFFQTGKQVSHMESETVTVKKDIKKDLFQHWSLPSHLHSQHLSSFSLES